MVTEIIVIGGSGERVGKTRLATQLLLRLSAKRRIIALRVCALDEPCEMQIAECPPDCETQDSRLLIAGSVAVVRVTVQRPHFRSGLARGIQAARRLDAGTLMIISTLAGVEMKSPIDSWFVSGDGDWDPTAYLHRNRADHILTSSDVRTSRESGR